jgi:hypothetical protein
MNTSPTAQVYSAEVGGEVITNPSFGQIGWIDIEPGQPRARVFFDKGGTPRRYQPESSHDFLCGFYTAAHVYASFRQYEFG